MMPLISVITPTWQRRNLVLEATINLQEQSYPNLQHIIVSEGIDPILEEQLYALGPQLKIPTLYVECGRNWSSELDDSYCAAPVIMGQLKAEGDYQIPYADDETFDYDHIQKLYNHLIETGSDFVYSRCIMWYKDNPTNRFEIGVYPPVHGEITNFLYKRECLNSGFYRTHVTRAGDWDLVKRWMRAGLKCSMLDEVTMTHRADQ